MIVNIYVYIGIGSLYIYVTGKRRNRAKLEMPEMRGKNSEI